MFKQYDIELLREYEAKNLISARQHPSLPLVVWNYTAETQYGRLWDEITLSARGLVTDMQGNAVAMCIPKFFNLSEPQNDGLDVTDFDAAYEKLDGSLIHVFNYDGRWVCSSRGSFESDQAKWAQELIDSIDQHEWLQEGVTYVCELIHPENRIVLGYGEEYSLRLLTSFSDLAGYWQETGTEWKWPWDKAQEIPMEALPTYLDQSGIEGVVLVGDHGRAKIKTEEYVEHHRICTGLTTKNVLEHYIEHGNVDKLLEVAPDEWYERISQLVWAFETKVNFYDSTIRWQFRNVMESMHANSTRKEFAQAVQGQLHKSYFFKLLDGRDITDDIKRSILRDEKNGLEL